MLLRCAPCALLSSAAAFACGSQFAFPAAQQQRPCPSCPPPLERETYCGAAFLSPDNYSAPSENAELVAVQLIGRHGDRAPLVTKPYWDVTWDCAGEQQLSFFTGNATGVKPERAMITRERVSIPEDAPFSSSMWRGSCDVGQLTPRGASAQRQLGAQLRQVYVEALRFLPETFHEGAGICVRSTAHSRNKQSASRILSGLYPGEFRPDGSIVDMVTLPKEIEHLEPNPASCPAQDKIIRAIMKSKRFKAHVKQNRLLFKKLHAVFGDPASPRWPEARTFLSYFEHLAPRVCHQMPIPCDRSLQTCLTNEDVDAAMRHARWEMAHIFQNSPHSRQLNRLVTGSFLAELRAKMRRHADSSAPSARHHHHRREPSFEIYSAQEETLASLLGAFHVRNPTIPPYSSSIIVELWRRRPGSGGDGAGFFRLQIPSSGSSSPSTDTDEAVRYDDFFVRIWHNGKLLDVQWCDMNACPARVIWENTKELVPRNIEEECRAKKVAAEQPGDGDDRDRDPNGDHEE